MEQSQPVRMEQPQDRWLWIIQELFFELLARLGTGIIFLVSAYLALAPIRLLSEEHKEVFQEVQTITGPLITGRLPLFTVFLLLLAYLLGLIFSRLDIKTPDRLSFQRRAKCLYWELLKRKDKDESKKCKETKIGQRSYILLMRARRTFQIIRMYLVLKLFDEVPEDEFEGYSFENWLIREFACSSSANCEFPYIHLGEYLKTRKLSNLGDLVTWDPTDRTKKGRRTRNFIDLLKIPIRFYGGSRVMHIIRNETNIRFLSSMWWAARILTWISLLALIPMLWYPTSPYFATTFIIFGAAGLIRWGITNYIHDLRIREVVQVLGTACMLCQERPETFKKCIGKEPMALIDE
jgi:hypothetical protein